jgi:hypothetical protein
MSYLQFIWYKDHARVPFEFYNDWEDITRSTNVAIFMALILKAILVFIHCCGRVFQEKGSIIWRQPWISVCNCPLNMDGMYEVGDSHGAM